MKGVDYFNVCGVTNWREEYFYSQYIYYKLLILHRIILEQVLEHIKDYEINHFFFNQ